MSWCSENPTRVMTSSTEVECRALSQFAKENLWQRDFFSEIGIFPHIFPTRIFEDNSAAISLSTSAGTPHKRSKHFGLEFAFFKECVEHGEVCVEKINTDLQLADMLTKALPKTKFDFFREKTMCAQTELCAE